jgi:hypothetical protein
MNSGRQLRTAIDEPLLGSKQVACAVVDAPTSAEMNAYTSQLLWVVLRVIKTARTTDAVRPFIAPKWLGLLTSLAFPDVQACGSSYACVTRVLALKILQLALPFASMKDEECAALVVSALHLVGTDNKADALCAESHLSKFHEPSFCCVGGRCLCSTTPKEKYYAMGGLGATSSTSSEAIALVRVLMAGAMETSPPARETDTAEMKMDSLTSRLQWTRVTRAVVLRYTKPSFISTWKRQFLSLGQGTADVVSPKTASLSAQIACMLGAVCVVGGNLESVHEGGRVRLNADAGVTGTVMRVLEPPASLEGGADRTHSRAPLYPGDRLTVIDSSLSNAAAEVLMVKKGEVLVRYSQQPKCMDEWISLESKRMLWSTIHRQMPGAPRVVVCVDSDMPLEALSMPFLELPADSDEAQARCVTLPVTQVTAVDPVPLDTNKLQGEVLEHLLALCALDNERTPHSPEEDSEAGAVWDAYQNLLVHEVTARAMKALSNAIQYNKGSMKEIFTRSAVAKIVNLSVRPMRSIYCAPMCPVWAGNTSTPAGSRARRRSHQFMFCRFHGGLNVAQTGALLQHLNSHTPAAAELLRVDPSCLASATAATNDFAVLTASEYKRVTEVSVAANTPRAEIAPDKFSSMLRARVPFSSYHMLKRSGNPGNSSSSSDSRRSLPGQSLPSSPMHVQQQQLHQQEQQHPASDIIPALKLNERLATAINKWRIRSNSLSLSASIGGVSSLNDRPVMLDYDPKVEPKSAQDNRAHTIRFDYLDGMDSAELYQRRCAAATVMHGLYGRRVALSLLELHTEGHSFPHVQAAPFAGLVLTRNNSKSSRALKKKKMKHKENDKLQQAIAASLTSAPADKQGDKQEKDKDGQVIKFSEIVQPEISTVLGGVPVSEQNSEVLGDKQPIVKHGIVLDAKFHGKGAVVPVVGMSPRAAARPLSVSIARTHGMISVSSSSSSAMHAASSSVSFPKISPKIELPKSALPVSSDTLGGIGRPIPPKERAFPRINQSPALSPKLTDRLPVMDFRALPSAVSTKEDIVVVELSGMEHGQASGSTEDASPPLLVGGGSSAHAGTSTSSDVELFQLADLCRLLHFSHAGADETIFMESLGRGLTKEAIALVRGGQDSILGLMSTQVTPTVSPTVSRPVTPSPASASHDFSFALNSGTSLAKRRAPMSHEVCGVIHRLLTDACRIKEKKSNEAASCEFDALNKPSLGLLLSMLELILCIPALHTPLRMKPRSGWYHTLRHRKRHMTPMEFSSVSTVIDELFPAHVIEIIVASVFCSIPTYIERWARILGRIIKLRNTWRLSSGLQDVHVALISRMMDEICVIEQSNGQSTFSSTLQAIADLNLVVFFGEEEGRHRAAAPREGVRDVHVQPTTAHPAPVDATAHVAASTEQVAANQLTTYTGLHAPAVAADAPPSATVVLEGKKFTTSSQQQLQRQHEDYSGSQWGSGVSSADVADLLQDVVARTSGVSFGGQMREYKTHASSSITMFKGLNNKPRARLHDKGVGYSPSTGRDGTARAAVLTRPIWFSELVLATKCMSFFFQRKQLVSTIPSVFVSAIWQRYVSNRNDPGALLRPEEERAESDEFNTLANIGGKVVRAVPQNEDDVVDLFEVFTMAMDESLVQ